MSRKKYYHKAGGVVIPINRSIDPSISVAPPTVSASYFTAVTVTASATPHTKGAWSELFSAAQITDNFDGLEVIIESSSVSTANSSALGDIGFGAAGSEVVKIADLAVGFSAGTGNTAPNKKYILPFPIPSGTRVAARIQSVIVSGVATFRVRPFKYDTGVRKPIAIDSMGAVSSDSRGTILTPAGANNVKSAYTEITASTSHAYVALFLGVQGASTNNMSTTAWAIDIATGSAGSEVVVAADLHYGGNAAESIYDKSPISPLLFVDIAAGVRLAARYSRSAGSGLDLILYGVREV